MSDTELMDERKAEPVAAEPFRRPLIYTGRDLEFPIHAQKRLSTAIAVEPRR